MDTNGIKKHQKNATNYECELCDFKCSKQSEWNRHIMRPKHLNNLQMMKNDNIKPAILNEHFTCDCGNIYNFKSGLYRHKKKCTKNAQNVLANESVNEIVIKLINQNKELQQMLLDQNNKFFEMAKDAKDTKNTTNNTVNNNNNTTNNNNFNLQFFLNDTCKDALNLVDFVSSLQVKLKDLEETAKIGYTNGVSRIFINGLNDLDVNMRPIHCSDLKRETLYIKNDDKWTKEDHDKSNITKAIKKVSNKNIKQVFEWQKKYPEYNDPDSKQNDKYQEMLFTAMGGSTDDEQSNNLDKIIRNITKEVVIDKGL
jgi:hypothetical protein